MEFAVATSTITGFVETLFGGTLSFVFSVITLVWPYVMTLMVIGMLVGVVWGLTRLIRRR